MNQSSFNQLVESVCEVVVSDPAKPLVDLGVDSLGYLNLMLAVEARYGIEIDPDRMSDEDLATPVGIWRFAEELSRISV